MALARNHPDNAAGELCARENMCRGHACPRCDSTLGSWQCSKVKQDFLMFHAFITCGYWVSLLLWNCWIIKVGKSRESNHSPVLPRPPVPHVPKCHLHKHLNFSRHGDSTLGSVDFSLKCFCVQEPPGLQEMPKQSKEKMEQQPLSGHFSSSQGILVFAVFLSLEIPNPTQQKQWLWSSCSGQKAAKTKPGFCVLKTVWELKGAHSKWEFAVHIKVIFLHTPFFKVSLKQNNVLWCIFYGSFLLFLLGISGVVIEIDDDERGNVQEDDEQHDPVGISIDVLGSNVCLQRGGTAVGQLLRQPVSFHIHREKDHGYEDEDSWKIEIRILEEELYCYFYSEIQSALILVLVQEF